MRIVADSSCDLYEMEGLDFRTVPLTIYTDERSFLDEPSLKVTDMLDYLENYRGRSYTSCPSIDAWHEAFRGADEIFVMTVTSALSGSYNSALSAADMYREENPDVKISIIDSLSTGGEEIVLLLKLAELVNSGADFETVDRQIREYQKHTRLFFAFISLHNLTQNGRVNKTVAAALSVLRISVTGTASEEGKISVTGKARGEKKVIANFLNDMKKAGYAGGRVVITYTENEEGAQHMKDAVLQEYPQAEVLIYPTRGLCSYYMERKGIVVACETA
ncbi:MAG: DegV family protein [Erysipelotrichaceae bacterium]|nr:DegV family protein [Erysipelotrichaceae bacterium]